jgi:hypothetical protein
LLGRGKALEMFTNYFLGYVSTKALRGALVVALGATLAALAAVALVAASGTAVGQQQGQEAAPPSQGQESSVEPWGAPNQSRARKGISRLQSGWSVSTKV